MVAQGVALGFGIHSVASPERAKYRFGIAGGAEWMSPFQGFKRLLNLCTQGGALGCRIKKPFQGKDSLNQRPVRFGQAMTKPLGYFRASYTTWASSGRISLSSASRTAAGLPGIVSSTTWPTTPPIVRLSIAAGPMSS
jgi:hypothetical protein